MAFEYGNMQNIVNGVVQTLSYANMEDDIATITGAGYFDPLTAGSPTVHLYEGAWAGAETGDLIQVKGSDGGTLKALDITRDANTNLITAIALVALA